MCGLSHYSKRRDDHHKFHQASGNGRSLQSAVGPEVSQIPGQQLKCDLVSLTGELNRELEEHKQLRR
jgi:hypothetical protein